MNFTEKITDTQNRIENKAKKAGKGKYGHVLKMARTPKSNEYIKVLQIAGAGIILIGGLGFLIYWCWYNLYNTIIYILEL